MEIDIFLFKLSENVCGAHMRRPITIHPLKPIKSNSVYTCNRFDVNGNCSEDFFVGDKKKKKKSISLIFNLDDYRSVAHNYVYTRNV